MAKEVKKRRMDAVLCRHIHHTSMYEIDGVLYLNDGDWIESRTAMVEHHDGHFELVEWQKVRGQVGELVNR